MSVLRNVKVLWTSIQAPDTKFEHVWRTDVIVSKEQANALQAEAKAVNPKGIKFRKGENGEIIFRVKRKIVKATGVENKAPVCQGTKKNELTGQLNTIKALVGNGSLCNVQYNFYHWDNSFGDGVNADFCGLQVLELISYGVVDGDEFDEVEASSKPEAPEPSKGDDDYDEEDFS